MLTRTASIGIAVLKSAIGLRKNYKETVTESKIDFTETGCINCIDFIKSFATACTQDQFPFCDKCNTCARCIINTKTRTMYVNEKNKYGVRHELKKNALLLFMYLHYLNPDKAGLVYINIEEASSILQCTERTIKNNLKLLHRHHYIDLAIDPVYPGYYKLFLTEYNSYFLPADKGGRGYCVIPTEHLKILLNLPDINSIRLAIRNLIPETLFNKEKRIEKSYIEVQRDLPTYCSKRKIRELTTSQKFTEIFEVQPKKYFITIKTRAAFDISNIANIYKEECRDKVTQLLEKLQAESSKKKLRNKILLLEEELNDICNIALKIPLKFVLEAVQQINQQYILNNLPISNIGALVRTVATEFYQLAA